MPASFKCNLCSRTFSTNHGKNIHLSACRKKLGSSQPVQQPSGQQISAQSEPNNNNNVQVQSSLPNVWGQDLTKEDVHHTIDQIYNEIVFWRRNLFMLPSGAAGKKFITETTKWIEYWNNDSIYFKDIALKVLMVMPALLLQKPTFKSTSKEHSKCLSRRLTQWESGDLNALLREARTIQDKLHASKPNNMSEERLAKTFAKLVLEGKINAAMKLLDKENSKGVLPLSQSTIEELRRKHPDATEAETSELMDGSLPFVDPVMFQNITESTIMDAALRTKGSSGPSGLDADGWRRILVSKNFATAGKNLRCALATFAQKVSTVEIEATVEENKIYTNLEAYLACRLIPLDKNPGVRPIGIGEVLRRIVGKAILSVIKPDIINSAGNLQLCAGQASGCEAAVHAIKDIFDAQSTDAALLVDADNAFNSLNRAVLLHNIRYLCPPMATYIRNCYSIPSRLFVLGGTEILSSEGTTQGDPLAMPVYAIGITPLLEVIKSEDARIKHVAFADDLSGAGNLTHLRTWWDNIATLGPKLGYYPNALKSWLVVKSEAEDEAQQVFADTNIKITTEGRKYLGGFIGSEDGQSKYVEGLVDTWCDQLTLLSKIARSEPQAAYAVFTSGFRHKLTYYIRTIPNIKQHLVKLDEVVDNKFIPAITEGHICSTDERLLLSLPVKKGGLAIPIFSNIADFEYANSRLVTDQLVTNIRNQDNTAPMDTGRLKTARKNVIKERDEQHKTILQQIREKMNQEQIRANDLSRMKGASSWLTTLPLKSENFNLNKREFYDALSLRYRWTPKYLPSTCPCGKRFDVDHAMSCMKGGFVHRRHDDVRDLFGDLLNDVCYDVQVEPQLETITGEVLPCSANLADEARLDVSARGFWQRGQRAFFDVRVFNPFAKSHLNQKLNTTFTSNENEKKRQYNRRVIEVEHGTFTPLVFTPYGGSGREAERFISELALKLSTKKQLHYNNVIRWLRVKLSINLVRSAVLCLRGTRTLKRLNNDIDNVDIVNSFHRIE
jgi:hypothetical protein